MNVVGHTAWYLPMASAIREIREGAVAELCRCLDKFGEVGAKWMNLHPGPPYALAFAQLLYREKYRYHSRAAAACRKMRCRADD